MSMLIGAGDLLNNLARMASSATVSPSADSNYPVTNLYDLLPNVPFRWGSTAANPYVIFDFNGLTNGGFEDSTALNGWTDASAGASNACTKTTTAGEFSAGAAAMKATIATTGGSNQAARYQDETVRAGEQINFTCTIRGDSTATARVQIQNRQTQKYLTSGGAWQTAQTDFATRSTNSFATSSVSFTVESAPAYRTDMQTYTLRVTCYVNGSVTGSGFFDEVYLWPSSSILTWHGHNLDPGVSLEIRRDTAGFSGAGTVEATIAGTSMELTGFQKFGATRTERYWKVTVSGTPSAQPWFGEILIFQYLTAAKMFAPPDDRGFDWAQTRAGDRSMLMLDYPVRDLDETFNLEASQYLEQRDSILLRSRIGHFPLCVIPSDAETACIYGRLEPSFRAQRTFVDGSVEFHSGLAWKLTELRLPSFVR